MAQIIEDYCSFELSKLLKEKGFDIYCSTAYFNGGLVDYTMFGFCDGELLPAPSLSLACKWLREVHGLFISIEPCFDYKLKHVVYLAFIQNVTDIDVFKEGRVEVASGYIVEAVYGKALKYCLEHLI